MEGRSEKRETKAACQALKDRGVALISLKEKIDTSSAAGELIFMCSARSRVSSDG